MNPTGTDGVRKKLPERVQIPATWGLPPKVSGFLRWSRYLMKNTWRGAR